MKQKGKSELVLLAFGTGVFVTMFAGAFFKIEDIATLEDARRVYGLLGITGVASVFFGLFLVIAYDGRLEL